MKPSVIDGLRKFSFRSIHRIEKITRLDQKKPHKVKWWVPLICLLVLVVLVLVFMLFQTLKKQFQALQIFKNGKYLVLLQNNAEMRPTGGFIGSFAVVEFKNFKVKHINFNTNIFKIDNEFAKSNFIASPEPLSKINNNIWTMHDSNFAVDFPESARQTAWFLKEETGEKVDGVIVVNATVVKDILKLTGPVTMKDYSVTVSADNFFSILSEKIEKEYFLDKDKQTENEPKSILKDLMPLVFNKALGQSKVTLIKLIYNELSQKQIMFYTNADKTQKAILAQGWGGEVKPSSGDYLYVNNANITDLRTNKNAGAKTSLSIDEKIDYETVHKIGGWESNLTVTRTHRGTYTWPDGVNQNWMRILVPKGTNLVKAELNGKDIVSEVRIGEEADKMFFGLWVVTVPGQTNVLNLSYVLPPMPDNYELLVQKQSGNLGDDLKVKVNGKEIFDGILNSDTLIH